ncbi:MAG: hypothetical protein QM775_15515 [Pirellulales bacterium]
MKWSSAAAPRASGSSRASELQALRDQIIEVDAEITAAAGALKVAEGDVAQRETEFRLLEGSERECLQQAVDERSRGKALDQQRQQLTTQLDAIKREVQAAAP